mmetsp:Transcript_27979/g.46353  ORF Transcript_27979/g.46353 Transcript_27979/m.46353 type:complete len:384 (+) Transcript_27979:168-1319(+)
MSMDNDPVIILKVGGACTERIMKSKTTGIRSGNLAVFLLMSISIICLAPNSNNMIGNFSSSPELSGALRRTAKGKPSTGADLNQRDPLGTDPLGNPPPYSPFYLPVSGPLNPEMASALIHEIPHEKNLVNTENNPLAVDAQKLWSMFALQGWTRRGEGTEGCFATEKFWENLLEKETCDRNWYRGGYPDGMEENNKEWRADYYGNQNNPGVVGYEEDLGPFNCKEIKKKKGEAFMCDEIDFIDSAHQAGHNMLRLDSRFGWNMCRNLEWVICAIRGLLPNQGDGKIRFATTPKIDVQSFLFRDGGCDQHDCALHYSVNDVFFVEVALISYLCKNREEVFGLEVGDEFDCDFDTEALERLVAAGNQSSGGLGSPDFWQRPSVPE